MHYRSTPETRARRIEMCHQIGDWRSAFYAPVVLLDGSTVRRVAWDAFYAARGHVASALAESAPDAYALTWFSEELLEQLLTGCRPDELIRLFADTQPALLQGLQPRVWAVFNAAVGLLKAGKFTLDSGRDTQPAALRLRHTRLKRGAR